MNDTLVLNMDFMPSRMWPLSVVPWHRAVKGIFSGAVTVIHDYEDRVIRSPSVTMPMPSVVMLTRYIRPAFSVALNNASLLLRDRYTCQYCMKAFKGGELTWDHVLPEKYGGKIEWTNIVAACGPCNWGKGSDRRIVPKVMPYRPSYYELVQRAKEFPLVVPDAAWADYLQWPEENLIVRKINQKNKSTLLVEI